MYVILRVPTLHFAFHFNLTYSKATLSASKTLPKVLINIANSFLEESASE